MTPQELYERLKAMPLDATTFVRMDVFVRWDDGQGEPVEMAMVTLHTSEDFQACADALRAVGR